MPIASGIEQLRYNGIEVFFTTLNKSVVPTSQELGQFKAIEEITMIGYPSGLWDKVNNLPPVRRGITATHPIFNLNGKEEIRIDAACYPGSSGSPVLI